MAVDGEPRLACEVFARALGPEVRVAPLPHLDIERDLRVDTQRFLRAHRAVRPWLHPTDDPRRGPVGERLQTPGEQAVYLDTAQCIGCMLCMAACPQIPLSDDFLGPAALAAGHRFATDSRDVGPGARDGAMQAELGVWGCTLVGSCSDVCPKGVDPAAAIQREKVRGALSWLRALVPGGGSQ